MIGYVPSSARLVVDNSFFILFYFVQPTSSFLTFPSSYTCRLILRTKLILFLSIFLGTFLIHWFPITNKFLCGINGMRTMLCPFWILLTSFWLLTWLCFFSITMIPRFWRRFGRTLKATIYRFAWNGQLWILSLASNKDSSIKVLELPIFCFVPLCCFQLSCPDFCHFAIL
jgi:hypothetical protein